MAVYKATPLILHLSARSRTETQVILLYVDRSIPIIPQWTDCLDAE